MSRWCFWQLETENILANSPPFAEILHSVNQLPGVSCLIYIKKLELENVARLSLYGGSHGFIRSIFLENFKNYYLNGHVDAVASQPPKSIFYLVP
jgi:hypothetical protein